MKKLTILTSIFTLLLIFGCKKQSNNNLITEAPPIQVKKVNHTWYYFDNSNYVQVEKPYLAPSKPIKPWTEQIRISSANNSLDNPYNINSAFAIVNRLGILTFENEKITLSRDVNLFNDRTAGNLIFLNETPIFSVYKSSFFNDTVTDPLYKNNSEKHLFLVQFDQSAKIAYPIINCNSLTDEPNSEVTDFSFDGNTWYCSIKTISDTKNLFTYVKWQSTIPLLSISPNTAKDNITVSPISQETFRLSKEQIDYKNAPERIKKLLAGFDKKIPFYVELKSAGGLQIRKYWNDVPSSEKPLNAKGIIAETWSCVLFEDGTLFIEGALPGKHLLKDGNPLAIRLPKLPANYIYSDFVISGTTLYAAWEETNFFQTGKAGFLQVNLDKTLYSKIL